ncbi:hypothetical protein UY3_00765 [Chelonia mydas]|uniref:Uncharacterized protein n=1 Tax=Chelonia mydas TaxID=8469 RepID=M7CL85_CHEMY|nr:hypothetical protein UY3_00765 [Chelonia mydas]
MLTTSYKGKRFTFTFERQFKFSACLDLAFAQNQSVVQPRQATPQRDIWQKQPPDFSHKFYKSSRPSRKATEKEKEELKKANSTESETKQQLPKIKTSQFHTALERKKELPKIVTRFPHVGSYEVDIMFVKNGKYKTGVYQDPKPHDFRQENHSHTQRTVSAVRACLQLPEDRRAMIDPPGVDLAGLRPAKSTTDHSPVN